MTWDHNYAESAMVSFDAAVQLIEKTQDKCMPVDASPALCIDS